MRNYVLKEAVIKDSKILAELMGEFYHEDGHGLDKEEAEEGFKNLLKDKIYGRVWLIEINGKVAGYIVLTFSYAMEFYGRDGFIDDFFIKKDYRCKGIGKKVLKDIEDIAREESIKVLFLEAHDSIKAHLLEFYGNSGFVKRQCRLMSKKLQKD